MHQLTLSQLPAHAGIVGAVSHIMKVTFLSNSNAGQNAPHHLYHIVPTRLGTFT